LKSEIRDGKTIIIFDSIEEVKWYYHRKFCKDSSDQLAKYMMETLGKIRDVAEANKLLKTFCEPYEVKV